MIRKFYNSKQMDTWRKTNYFCIIIIYSFVAIDTPSTINCWKKSIYGKLYNSRNFNQLNFTIDAIKTRQMFE